MKVSEVFMLIKIEQKEITENFGFNDTRKIVRVKASIESS